MYVRNVNYVQEDRKIMFIWSMKHIPHKHKYLTGLALLDVENDSLAETKLVSYIIFRPIHYTTISSLSGGLPQAPQTSNEPPPTCPKHIMITLPKFPV
jgi:hypothetical protein